MDNTIMERYIKQTGKDGRYNTRTTAADNWIDMKIKQRKKIEEARRKQQEEKELEEYIEKQLGTIVEKKLEKILKGLL